jgi:hypothetical protein
LGLTPEEKATFLENFQEFKEEHRTYAMKGESQHALTQKDVKHHYIAFVLNQRGQLVELDGRKKGPHIVQDNCADVLRGAISEIQRRLENGEYSQSCSVMTLNAAWD